MTSVLLSLLLTLRGLAQSRTSLHLEVLALRHQLQVLQRSRPKRLRLVQADRWLWAWLSRIWTAWRSALVIVKPETPTFVTNHLGQIVAADFFLVPTATCRVLFVLVLLAHERRRVVHVAVTACPTAVWTAQQLREAFPWDTAPRYLLRDHDHSFTAWANTASAMDIQEILTAHGRRVLRATHRIRPAGVPRPRHRPHCIGIAPRAEHVTLRTTNDRARIYHSTRTRCAPIPRPIAPHSEGRVVAIPQVGDLHNRYERHAA
jgi:putative transposase